MMIKNQTQPHDVRADTHTGTLQPLCRCESRVFFLVNVPDELVLHALGPFDHASLHLNELYTGPFGGGGGGRLT